MASYLVRSVCLHAGKLIAFDTRHKPAQRKNPTKKHLKVDELLRVTKEAQNAMLGLEALDLKQLEALRKQYRQLGEGETISLDGTVVQEKGKQDLNEC